MKKTLIAPVVGALVVGGAVAAGTVWFAHADHHDAAVTTVAAPTSGNTPIAVSPKMGAVLAPGMYNFVIKGGGTMPVALQPCGDGCLALDQGPSEAVPNGFHQEVKLVGTRYEGQTMSQRGIVCASDNKARPAETKYSINSDGTDGLVEVLGQPCGPGAQNVPLAFTLTPAPPPP